MASIEDIARQIDSIEEPDRRARLHLIAKAISDDFAPGYKANFNEFPDTPARDDMAASLRAHGYTVTPPSEADSLAEVNAAFEDDRDAPDGPEYDPRDVAFTPEAKELIADLVADDTPAPFHAGQTVDAATAWEAMGQGWCVNDVGRRSDASLQYMGGDGLAYDTHDSCDPFTESEWNEHCTTPQVLVRIHPSAHQHAMQRLLADGLKVGSRVEVVHHENGEGAHYEGWIRDHPVGSSATVKTPNWLVKHRVELDTGYVIPAHCLRLLPAEQDAPAPNPEDQVPPATTTGEGAGLRVGDEVWARGRTTIPVDQDGEVEVRFGDESWNACCIPASALRPVAASEGGGE